MTLTNDLQATLQAAFSDAERRRHEFVMIEHVLFAMTDNAKGARMLRALGVDLPRLRRALDAFFAESVEPLPRRKERKPQPTPTLERVIQRASFQLQAAGKDSVDLGNVLASFFHEPASHAVYLLEEQGVRRLEVLDYISHGIAKDPGFAEEGVGAREAADGALPEEDEEDGGTESKKMSALAAFATDLTRRATDGEIDPLIGRQTELERTIQILCRRRKNNPIFVGDPGVGKTAIVEGLALRIAEGKVPAMLADARIFAVDMGSLIAGTKYRGEFESRLKKVLAELRKQPHAILFIDEIHTIYGAGATGSGTLDASNMLKPVLSSGKLRCIGSTSFNDYRSVFEKDRALARRFQKIDVLEPTLEETIAILEGLRGQYEAHHQVVYGSKTLKAAAELAATHLRDSRLPDKAIDVIDEAGAMVRLRGVDPGTRVTVADVEAVVAKMAGIPPRTVSSSDRDKLATLESDLKAVIFGQDQAIGNLVSAIKLSRSGLGPPERPVGSFLFSGPTGVGKTELAKQLARVLGIEFLRFDMSEYMEKHTVSRLIGAPPGYVGFDQGGLLTDAIRKTPHAVLVLDEIEKAHPDVFNVLLQVMDHATLTDNNGRKADFRNVILVMTTNAGAQALSREALGFGAKETGGRDKAEIERTFSPEFRNRLDAWITFSSLTAATLDRIVDKFIRETRDQLAAKQVTLEIAEPARVYLRDKGYDKIFGARAMNRTVQTELKRPLADAILFGDLAGGGIAEVSLADDRVEGPGLVFKYLPAPAAPAAEIDDDD